MRPALILFVVILSVYMARSGVAGTLYQWRDAAGQIHFTDDLARVPKMFRSNSSRDIKPLAAISGRVSLTSNRKFLDGRSLYEKKCSACHVIGFEKEGKREGLSWAIIDENTKYPRPLEALFKRMRRAADGKVDMPRMSITDDELMAIGKFLIKASVL